MNIKLITVCSNPEHAQVLIQSAIKHGWDLEVISVTEWKGFGTKLIATYEYLKEHPEVAHFVFSDAFDVVVLGGPEEFEEKMRSTHGDYDMGIMLISAEKGCWPDGSLAEKYDYNNFHFQFKYVNSGLYYSDSCYFKEMIEKYPVNFHDDDQLYLTNRFLEQQGIFGNKMKQLDMNQTVFNSHSFVSDGEYTYENNRIQILGNEPVFIHFNGKTVDEEFNKRITI